MPEINVYSSHPGLEVLLGKGAVINAITRTTRSPSFASGLQVLGIVGGVTNDEGAPGTCVELTNKAQDLLGRFGPFSPYVGEGAASGYEGNLAALMYGVDAPRIVLCAADLALKDKTITDATAVDLEVQVARTRTLPATTGVAATDVFTSVAHALAVGDGVLFTAITGGTGLVIGTTYTVATAPTADTFTLTGVDMSADLTAATALAISEAGEAYTLPAGTRISDGAVTPFIVRTLEPVYWAAADGAKQGVRVAKVSGTVAALNTVDTFVDTLSDATVAVVTTAVTVPDDVDAAELVLRYTDAFAATLTTTLGQSIDVMICDRNEAAICDALATHIATARAAGTFLRGVVSPPVGTTAAVAQGAAGEGIGRATLDQDKVAYAHPGWVRAFPLDADNLTAPDYLATFTSHVLLAEAMCLVRPEENPARPLPEMKRYGASGVESLATAPVGATHWAAHICMPVFERLNGGLAPSYRDGVMADGDQIATVRTLDWVTENVIERATPFHKTIASASNREDCVDSVRAWLQRQLDDERIAGFALSEQWDAENRHLTIPIVVEEIGTLDVITFSIEVGSGVLAPGDAGAAA